MDLNLVVLLGKLAAPAELREFESGSRLLRSLITVRSDGPRRRVDVVPVTLWDPPPDHELLSAAVGENVWATGSVQRRFWSAAEGRRSRLEIVAHHVQIYSPDQYDVVGGLAGVKPETDGPRAPG
ncbi:MAG: single-stranded DNA-binding protein [Actinomycetota bacterium]|nr:single-stranded DNA-binding protein [Actinomycetota bacterium]